MIKRSRATLRLLRGTIGELAYAREDAALSGAAAALAELRNTEVLVETVAGLIERSHDRRTQARLERLRASLARAYRELRVSQGTTMLQARSMLDAAWTQSRDWIVSDAWFCVAEVLDHSYRRARKAQRHAADSPSDARLHTLRKRTQRLRYQLNEISLQPVHAIADFVRRLTRLSDLLGKDHDLAMLQATLKDRRAGREQDGLRAVLTIIDCRRRRLQSRSQRLAKRLFRDKPRRFAHRLEAQWQRWEECLH
jgi:CHAD domain-containing protein